MPTKNGLEKDSVGKHALIVSVILCNETFRTRAMVQNSVDRNNSVHLQELIKAFLSCG